MGWNMGGMLAPGQTFQTLLMPVLPDAHMIHALIHLDTCGVQSQSDNQGMRAVHSH